MSQPVERLIADCRKSGNQRLIALADKWEADLNAEQAKGGFPENIPVQPQAAQTKIERQENLKRGDLEKIIKGQVERYIALGFHTEIYRDLAEEEAKARYLADFTLPEDAIQQAEYAGRLDIPLAVEPRISLPRKHILAKRIKESDLDDVAKKWRTSQVIEYINTDKITDLTEHLTDRPYLIFTHDGQKYRPYTDREAVKLFVGDEVGSPQLEVTDLFLQHPEFFDGRGIDAVGSRGEHGYVPYLDTFYGGPRVRAGLVDDPGRDWGAGSRGKEIIRLGV